MQWVKAAFWFLSLPFRATLYVLRVIAEPGAYMTGVMEAGSWWVSASVAKDLLSVPSDHPAAALFANFSANTNVYAAALTGASIFFAQLVDTASGAEVNRLRRQIERLEYELRAQRMPPPKPVRRSTKPESAAPPPG